MSLFGSIKDHFLIGGPNAVAGWGLLVLLVFSGGVQYAKLKPGVDLGFFLIVLAAAALTGNGVYAINAVYDLEADRVNKPNRPLPSGRMKPEHALKYTYALMALGLVMSSLASLWLRNYLMILLWSIFTVLGIAYSKPPIKLKARHIFGNLCFATFAALTYFIGITLVPTEIPWFIELFLLLIILYIGGLVTMKDFYDYEGDKKNGDITLPVKVGRRKAAVISICMMSLWAARIPIIPYGTLFQPPLLDWFLRNLPTFTMIVSFTVYIAIDYVGRNHVISDAYSRVIYFYCIFYAAYGFLKGSIFPISLATSWVLTLGIDSYIALAVYAIVATVTILKSRKIGRDILKPTERLRKISRNTFLAG